MQLFRLLYDLVVTERILDVHRHAGALSTGIIGAAQNGCEGDPASGSGDNGYEIFYFHTRKLTKQRPSERTKKARHEHFIDGAAIDFRTVGFDPRHNVPRRQPRRR